MDETGVESMDKKWITYRSFRKKPEAPWGQQKHKCIFAIMFVFMVLAIFGSMHLDSFAQNTKHNAKVV